MWKYKILIFLVTFGFSVDLYAQRDLRSFECISKVSDKEAEALMDQVQKKYTSINTVQAEFLQTSYLAAVDTAEGSSGQVWLVKPGKMKWHYDVPEEQTFLMVGETLYYHQPLDNQVMIQNFKDAVLTDLPVAFLLGIGDLRKDFILQSACRSSNGIVLKLKQAKQKSQDELEGFSLLIDTTISFPSGAEILHVGGNKTSILLEKINLQEKIADSVFKAEFPKGTDINDMRNR